MTEKAYKNNLYEGLSKLMKALANPLRLEIIEMKSIIIPGVGVGGAITANTSVKNLKAII